MFIQTEHIYLRALEPIDLELLYTCENDRLVWKVSNTITPFSKHILQQLALRLLNKYVRFV